MKQQTAVEWLINEIDMQFPSINIKWKEWMIDRAKQMEKEQIIKAHLDCWGTNKMSAERYYIKIYGSKESLDTSHNTQNK